MATRASALSSSTLKKLPSATSSPRNSSQFEETPNTAVLAALSRYFTSISKAFCSSATCFTPGTSEIMAWTSSNFSVAGTFVRETIPRVRPAPGRMIMVSKVPSIFLNRFMDSCFVASPIEFKTVREEIPMMTPSIIRNVRRRCRAILRNASTASAAICMIHLRWHTRIVCQIRLSPQVRTDRTIAQNDLPRRIGGDGIIVSNKDDGSTFPLKFLQDAHYLFTRRCIEIARGLIGEYQRRVIH